MYKENLYQSVFYKNLKVFHQQTIFQKPYNFAKGNLAKSIWHCQAHKSPEKSTLACTFQAKADFYPCPQQAAKSIATNYRHHF